MYVCVCDVYVDKCGHIYTYTGAHAYIRTFIYNRYLYTNASEYITLLFTAPFILSGPMLICLARP